MYFRKEEWLKVLIHECFHAFNMDFHEEKINFKNLFQTSFFIDSEFLVFESFVEFWAYFKLCNFFIYNKTKYNFITVSYFIYIKFKFRTCIFIDSSK